MKANLEELGEMQKELFRQQCDLDIQKAMVKHFIKKEKAKQLRLHVVGSSNKVNYEKGWELAMAHIHTSIMKDKDSFSAKHREALNMFIEITDFN